MSSVASAETGGVLMDYVVVDTDVVSFLFKGDTRASLYRQHLEGKVPAATRHGYPITAHNRGDFERIDGLVLISEAP